MYIDIILWILAIILVIGGMVGLVFPALPGAPVLYAGLFVAAWTEDFAYAGYIYNGAFPIIFPGNVLACL